MEAGGYYQSKVSVSVVFQLFCGGTDQKLVNKQVLAGQLIDHTEFSRIFFIRACEAVEDKQIFLLEICEHLVLDVLVLVLRNSHIYAAPCDFVMNVSGIYDKFVLRRTARIFSGRYGKGACIHQNTLSPL